MFSRTSVIIFARVSSASMRRFIASLPPTCAQRGITAPVRLVDEASYGY